MIAEPLTAEQRDELRRDLEQLETELQGQLQRIDQQSQPVQLDQQSVGRLSRMDAMQQQQMAQASQSHMRAHLSRVLLALTAIRNDDYGYCKSCDQPIPFARLKARPDTPLCIACQAQNEQ